VLRCVNSAAYATRTEITNLQQAIAYLGIKQVRNLAMAATIGELFSKEGNVGSYTRSGLWRHLVSVGICARLVATRQGFANFEDIFLAGLLHDVGLILEDEHVHKQFVEAINALHHERTLVETETTYLGFDHTILAESVTKSWHFPESVIAAVRYHHNSVAYRGEHINAVRCVEVANLLCSLKGICSVGINLVRFPQATVKALSLTKEDVLVLAKDLDHELAMNEKLFQM